MIVFFSFSLFCHRFFFLIYVVRLISVEIRSFFSMKILTFFESKTKNAVLFPANFFFSFVNLDFFSQLNYDPFFNCFFFYKFCYFFFPFQIFLYFIFLCFLYFNYFCCFFLFNLFFVSCGISFAIFLLFLFCIFFSYLSFFFEKFLFFNLSSFFLFSRNFFVLEEEDLWVSCNLFYFDHRIAESADLRLSPKSPDIEVFFTLLSIFYKFPQFGIDGDYKTFSKALQQTILGNNPMLYNLQTKVVEPYTRTVFQFKSSSDKGFQKSLFSLIESSFLQIEFRKTDLFFFRKLFKSLFLYNSRTLRSFKKRRKLFRKRFRQRFFFESDFLYDFRVFYGLPRVVSSKMIVSKKRKLETFASFVKPNSGELHFLASQFSRFQRFSRNESRFLKFFWISFPFYIYSIENFFFNVFPNLASAQFFFSKFKFLLNNFLNFMFLGQRQSVIINFFTFFLEKNKVAKLMSVRQKILDLMAETPPIDIPKDEAEDDLSVLQFPNFRKISYSTKSKTKTQPRKSLLLRKKTDILFTKQKQGFEILNVNRAFVFDDLRRIKESSKKKTIQNTKIKKASKNTDNINAEEKTRDELQKEKIKLLSKEIKVFTRKLLLPGKKRFFKSKRDLDKLSGISKGNDSELFSSKKRLRKKRFLRRSNTRLRALWIMRSRFFFPNKYNNSFPVNSKLFLTSLDLFKLLEYFYFVLGRDRDLFDNAAYAIMVSTLNDRFGTGIAKDLVSSYDHKQAEKVSVILHVQDDVLSLGSLEVSVKDFQTADVSSEVSSLDERTENPSFFFSKNLRVTEQSHELLSPSSTLYLSKLLIYYKSLSSNKFQE